MTILSNGLIWGILLIAFGSSLIIKALFGITIPIIRPLLGIFLIYIGTVVITNMYPSQSARTQPILFSKASFKEQERLAEKYTVLCGEGTIDLSELTMPAEPTHIDIETIMGASTIILNPAIPTKVMVSTAFAHTQLPDDTVISFGDYTYRTTTTESPLLIIHLKVVFGSTRVIER